MFFSLYAAIVHQLKLRNMEVILHYFPFNSLYTDELFQLGRYNKLGIVHLHVNGLQVRISKSSYTVNSEKKFVRVLFSRNFADAEFRENKTIGKWLKHLSFTDVGKSCQSHEFLK